MTQNNNDIGYGIKQCRKNLGYTQKQFSKMLGISVDTLSSYENGKTMPKMITIVKIAQISSQSTDEIIKVNKYTIHSLIPALMEKDIDAADIFAHYKKDIPEFFDDFDSYTEDEMIKQFRN